MLVVSMGAIVCEECGTIHAERLVGETLEYSNTHNAPLDENLKTRFMLRGGKVHEIVETNKWCHEVKHDLTVMASDRHVAIGEDVIKCAIELVDAVENLKVATVNTDGVRSETRLFRYVKKGRKDCIKWALLQLAHDQCHIYITVDALGKDVDIAQTNTLTTTLRRLLKVEPYCPTDVNHVEMYIRKGLVTAIRKETPTLINRRDLTKQVGERHRKVMGMWNLLHKAKLNIMKFKVKRDPGLLLGVYDHVTKTKRASRSVLELQQCLTKAEFDWTTLTL